MSFSSFTTSFTDGGVEEIEVRLVGGESTVVAVLAATITTTSATRGDSACEISNSLKSLLI